MNLLQRLIFGATRYVKGDTDRRAVSRVSGLMKERRLL